MAQHCIRVRLAAEPRCLSRSTLPAPQSTAKGRRLPAYLAAPDPQRLHGSCVAEAAGLNVLLALMKGCTAAARNILARLNLCDGVRSALCGMPSLCNPRPRLSLTASGLARAMCSGSRTDWGCVALQILQ